MILFIHTADEENVIIGLVKNGKFFARKKFHAQYHHSEKLLYEIVKLFTRYKVQRASVAGVVVVKGPGPFTALRVGVTVANTLSYAWKAPVVGVRLNEIKRGSFIDSIVKKLYRYKKENIVEPFYGKEPNIIMR